MLLSPLSVALTGAQRLRDLVQGNGRFIYKYDSRSLKELEGYNLLRHRGCVWALNVCSSAFGASLNLGAAAENALSWLFREHIHFLRDDTLGVVQRDGTIKLGGNALALLAVGSGNWSQRSSWQEISKRLAGYIVRSYLGGGQFIHKRRAFSLVELPLVSEYYPAQALFSLLASRDTLQDSTTLALCQDAILALDRQDYGVRSQNHWMMYAIEAHFDTFRSPVFLPYAARIAERIIVDDSYRRLGRATPIACRTEALLTFCRLARNANIGKEELRDRAMATIRQNCALQLESYLPDGAFRRNTGGHNVRIDYLQHNVMSFLGLAELARRTAEG